MLSLSSIFQLVIDLWGYNSIRNQDVPGFIPETGKIFVDCLDLKNGCNGKC